MANAIYLVCAGASFTCAILLMRGFFRSRSGLLLWSALYFLCQAATNTVLLIDLAMFPDIDMSLARSALTAIGAGVMLYGLIWEAR